MTQRQQGRVATWARKGGGNHGLIGASTHTCAALTLGNAWHRTSSPYSSPGCRGLPFGIDAMSIPISFDCYGNWHLEQAHQSVHGHGVRSLKLPSTREDEGHPGLKSSASLLCFCFALHPCSFRKQMKRPIVWGSAARELTAQLRSDFDAATVFDVLEIGHPCM